jgi:DNA-binding transcriptional ArsR family regulator/2-polyprenyl-3-methyl-5-hydroxy-6-metoxy-1,4-benzoquinol methylase
LALLDFAAMSLTAASFTPSGDFDLLSRLCRAAGDPLRLEILRALQKDAYGVLELCHIFGIRQPAMSHHLKVLAEAGLLYRRREGTTIFYGRSHRAPAEELDSLMQAIFAAADAIALRPVTAGAVTEIQSARSASSRDFFSANAAKFRAQQELIAPRAQYEGSVCELLSALLPEQRETALELGPGEGWLLPVLARHCARVIAIDNAPAMLEQARQYCTEHRLLDQAQLVAGDSSHARDLGNTVDIAVANMVLHHTASPAVVMQDLAAALKPGGLLLLTDLCAHDQAWAREACGDLWLGFAPEDLTRWALEAGLSEGESVYLALRNGFRIQLRVFHRSR